MTLNYQLTLDDYVAVVKSQQKIWPRLFVWLYSAFTFYYGWILFSSNSPVTQLLGVVCIGIALLLIFLSLFGTKIIWGKALKNSGVLAPTVLECDARQLVFHRKNSDNRIDWNWYSKTRETKDFVILHRTAKVFQIVPKRAFANEDDLNEFRAWAAQIGHEAAQVPPLPEPK